MNIRSLFRHAGTFCLILCFIMKVCTSAAGAGPADHRFPADQGWKPLFNGKNLDGWKFRNPAARKVWVVCDQVRLDPANPARLLPVGSGGTPSAVLLCGDDGRGSDILTTENFGDYQLHLEFTVPKGSNSGVYNRGLFEIQVFDSFGVPQLACHDCGALYERAVPAVNLSRPPGEWQSYDITMKGKKISLLWNGKSVYRDMDVRYGETDQAAFERLNQENAGKPEALRVKLRHENGKYVGYFGEGGTRSSLDGPDRPGPILLQGDHGPVAYRELYIRPLRNGSP
ncbi:MAG: 3-keto-disaccharide hydrolase [Isosphaeraceae bacterium]